MKKTENHPRALIIPWWPMLIVLIWSFLFIDTESELAKSITNSVPSVAPVLIVFVLFIITIAVGQEIRKDEGS